MEFTDSSDDDSSEPKRAQPTSSPPGPGCRELTDAGKRKNEEEDSGLERTGATAATRLSKRARRNQSATGAPAVLGFSEDFQVVF